jgi:hypothetical protein
MPTHYRIYAVIQMDFYLEGARFQQRWGEHVPIVGDEVRFDEVAYKVDYRIWIYEENPRVALNITRVRKTK